LVADLVRTQSTLQARSEQLQEIFASRWYRLARFFWRLRSGTIFRKAAPPRMAGEDSFARVLDSDAPLAEEPELRLVPSPNGQGVAVDLERQRWLAGAEMPALEELRIAAILDEPSEACLAPECELDTDFGASDWRERLEICPPHVLLVESALAGNGGGWTSALVSHPGAPQAGLPALRELVAWCRERDIPTAFWATRDPVGFEHFAAAAALFDHIFSVDADRIGAYRELPESAARSVAALPFAAQPRLHNPTTGEGIRHPEPAFVGTYDRSWQRESLEQFEELLEAGQRFNLAIYERHSDAIDAGRSFPARFHPSLEGRFSYAETNAIYKRHRVFLSAGPSASSPSGCPRQVFELLACGTPVLSAPSAAVEEILGDLVPIASDREQAIELLGRLLGDEEYRDGLATRGQRHVLASHTYRDRLCELATAVGFDVATGAGEETAVLLAAGEHEGLSDIVDALVDQSLAPNEVLVGLPVGADAEGDLDRLAKRFPDARIRTISQDGKASRSERLRELARLAAAPWVVPMAPTLRYGPQHLQDLIACTRFTDAEAIGFAATAADGPQRYTDAVPPHAALATRELVANRGWPRDEAAMRRWFAQGVRIYAGEALGE
jgi:spore maturation protein CgeB